VPITAIAGAAGAEGAPGAAGAAGAAGIGAVVEGNAGAATPLALCCATRSVTSCVSNAWSCMTSAPSCASAAPPVPLASGDAAAPGTISACEASAGACPAGGAAACVGTCTGVWTGDCAGVCTGDCAGVCTGVWEPAPTIPINGAAPEMLPSPIARPRHAPASASPLSSWSRPRGSSSRRGPARPQAGVLTCGQARNLRRARMGRSRRAEVPAPGRPPAPAPCARGRPRGGSVLHTAIRTSSGYAVRHRRRTPRVHPCARRRMSARTYLP
jgi:hypothetical protein